MTPWISRVRNLFAVADDRVCIISAYVGSSAVAELLGATKASVRPAVYTRWALNDLASGASDWRVWDVTAEHDVPLFACPRLHVKLYVADDRALIGSANATRQGLGLGPNPNLEVLHEVDANAPAILEAIEIVRQESTLASPVGPDVIEGQVEGAANERGAGVPIWLPRSDPDSFLRATAGLTADDDQTRRDRERIGVHRGTRSARNEIRKALRDMTAFRVVRVEFETRMTQMGASELRALMERRVTPDLSTVADSDIHLLARWLGHFGENTTMEPSAPGSEPRLTPGMMLGSEGEFV